MFLNSPATYLSAAAFRAQPNDYDLTAYTDAQLTDMLVRASGSADSIMRKSFQPQEVTEFFEGNGSSVLTLRRAPLIYVKNVQLVMPGFAPFALPLSQLIIDYMRGSIRSYSPLVFQSIGISNAFPRNGLMPLMVNYAYGLGYPVAPPSFTLSNAAVGGTLTAQSYDITVTSRTQTGESLESAVQSFTPSGGAIAVNITPSLGALIYRVYAAVHGGTRMLVGESPATNYGTATLEVDITSLNAPANYGTVAPPAADTSANPIPNAIIEATRLLTLSILYEQNNPANRGLYLKESGRKRESFRATDGNSAKGVSSFVQSASVLLEPFADSGVY